MALSILLGTQWMPSPLSRERGLVLQPPTAAAASRGQIYWGAIIDGGAYGYGAVPQDMRGVTTFEGHAAKPVSIIPLGTGWESGGRFNPFNTAAFDAIRAHGAIPLFTWQSFGSNAADYRSAVIASGKYDSYIRSWAQAAKAWGHPFFLRFDHEMDGWWYPWGEGQTSPGGPIVNGNQPGDYVRMWRHVHDIFVQVGATNATWIWCVNHESTTSQYPPFAQIYPGDAYVDWTGMDPYNRYTGSWLTFNQTLTGVGTDWIRNTYQQILNIAPTKPMMIVEYGSFESASDAGATPAHLRDLARQLASSPLTGVQAPRPDVSANATASSAAVGSKPAWLRDALLQQIPFNFPAIKAALYFNWGVGGTTIPIESSAASQAAFANGIASSYYSANSFAALTSSPIAPLTESVAFLEPVADTYLAQDAPRSTYGGFAPFLYVSGAANANRNALLRFDLSTISGKRISQAVLQLTLTGGSNATSLGTVNVKYNANNQWQEAYASWNNGLGSWDIAPTPLGALSAPGLRGSSYTVKLPLTSVQNSAGRLLSFRLDSNSPDDLVVASREAPDPLTRPQLILAFQ